MEIEGASTLKQVIFDREMNYKDHSLTFTGFQLPEDRGMLFKFLDDIYEIYGDDSKKKENKQYIRKAIKRYKSRSIELAIRSNKTDVELNMYGDYCRRNYLEDTVKVVMLPITTRDKEKQVKIYFRCLNRWVVR